MRYSAQNAGLGGNLVVVNPAQEEETNDEALPRGLRSRPPVRGGRVRVSAGWRGPG